MGTSGTISVINGMIRYSSPLYGGWDLPLDKILVIGEMTNELGPFADDYFFCFVIGRGRWVEASCYADGFEEFFADLCAMLGPLQLRLCNSATFASNIIWPNHLAGKPMFRFTDLRHMTLFGRKLGLPRNKQELSSEVLTAAGPGG